MQPAYAAAAHGLLLCNGTCVSQGLRLERQGKGYLSCLLEVAGGREVLELEHRQRLCRADGKAVGGIVFAFLPWRRARRQMGSWSVCCVFASRAAVKHACSAARQLDVRITTHLLWQGPASRRCTACSAQRTRGAAKRKGGRTTLLNFPHPQDRNAPQRGSIQRHTALCCEVAEAVAKCMPLLEAAG